MFELSRELIQETTVRDSDGQLARLGAIEAAILARRLADAEELHLLFLKELSASLPVGFAAGEYGTEGPPTVLADYSDRLAVLGARLGERRQAEKGKP